MRNLRVKNLRLKLARIVLSYAFLVAGIWTALSLDADHWVKGGIISAVWLSLAAIDELIFWYIMGK